MVGGSVVGGWVVGGSETGGAVVPGLEGSEMGGAVVPGGAGVSHDDCDSRDRDVNIVSVNFGACPTLHVCSC